MKLMTPDNYYFILLLTCLIFFLTKPPFPLIIFIKKFLFQFFPQLSTYFYYLHLPIKVLFAL